MGFRYPNITGEDPRKQLEQLTHLKLQEIVMEIEMMMTQRSWRMALKRSEE